MIRGVNCTEVLGALGRQDSAAPLRHLNSISLGCEHPRSFLGCVSGITANATYTRTMRWKLALYAVCSSILLAGCGGGTESSNVTQLIRQDGRVGTGAEAVSGRSVTVHYTGWLYDDSQPNHKGAKFDSSRDRDEPFSFTLGSGQVIAGWDEGVAGMKVGGQRTLTIPPAMGYGASGAGGVIPPNATLLFDVELLDVK